MRQQTYHDIFKHFHNLRDITSYLNLLERNIMAVKSSTSKFKNQTLLCSLKCAISGFKALLNERATKREMSLLLFSSILIWFNSNPVSLMLFVIALLMILFEAVNTSIESLSDAVTVDFNDKIKIAKDIAAVPLFLLSMLYVFLLGKLIWDVI